MSRVKKVKGMRYFSTIGDAKSDTGGDVLFVWPEPSVALSLAKEPVEEGVVTVVVHGGWGERRERRRD